MGTACIGLSSGPGIERRHAPPSPTCSAPCNTRVSRSGFRRPHTPSDSFKTSSLRSFLGRNSPRRCETRSNQLVAFVGMRRPIVILIAEFGSLADTLQGDGIDVLVVQSMFEQNLTASR